MARFAFLALPFPGHVAPLAAVAQELVKRGHSATFLHHPDLEPRIDAFGLDFAPLHARDPITGWVGSALARAARVRGWFGMRAVIRDFAYCSALFSETVPTAIRDLNIDTIVGDWLEPSCGVVAQHLELPYVSIAAALPLNWGPGDGSPYMGWRYRPSRLYRCATQSVQWGAEKYQKPVHDAIAPHVRAWQLAPLRRVQDWASGYAQITQLVPSLDLPRTSLIGCFHYCGPLRSPTAAFRQRPARAGRRRAFASLGSLQGHRSGVFEWIIEAAETLDLDLTIAHGGLLAPAEVARLSHRARIHAFVDYADVLADCDVAIMHGGLNGTLDTLAQGLPIVIVPLAFEQAAIAERVRRSGAGVICRRRRQGGLLADAIRTVLDDPSHAAAASRLRDEIASAGGAGRAADIIEQVARTRQPCLNAAAIAAQPELAMHALGAS